jgi:hypothetical protein
MLKTRSVRKIAIMTVFVFAWLNLAVGVGHAQQKTGKEDKSKSTEASAVGEPANTVEKQATDQEIKTVNKKKFPLLLVAGGVVVAGILLFLLLKKTKYTLTVSKGTGISGSPENGSYAYKKGSLVSYNYSLADGYKSLVVRLDGQEVSGSGSIAMNANHNLTVTSEQKTTYKLTVSCDSNCYRIASYSPALGVYNYQEGTEIQYSFTSTASGGLKVLIDGTLVCNNYAGNSTCSGSLIMNQDTVLMVNGN